MNRAASLCLKGRKTACPALEDVEQAKRWEGKNGAMKYAYYPGCALHGANVDFDESTLVVADALGLEFEEIPNWSCCGSSPAHSTDRYLATALPVRNLLAAKEISNDVLVCCAACFIRFKFVITTK